MKLPNQADQTDCLPFFLVSIPKFSHMAVIAAFMLYFELFGGGLVVAQSQNASTVEAATASKNTYSSLQRSGVSYLEAINSQELGVGSEFSVSFWVRVPEADQDGGVFVAKYGATGSWFFGNSYGKQGLGKLRMVFCTGNGKFSNNNTIDAYSTTRIIATGEWVHCYVGFKQGKITLYLDGKEEPNLSFSINAASVKSVATTTAPVMVGSLAGKSGATADVDELSVWSRLLSQAEIVELYNSGHPKDLNHHPAAQVLTGWWRLGDDLRDHKGNHGMVMKGGSLAIGSNNALDFQLTPATTGSNEQPGAQSPQSQAQANTPTELPPGTHPVSPTSGQQPDSGPTRASEPSRIISGLFSDPFASNASKLSQSMKEYGYASKGDSLQGSGSKEDPFQIGASFEEFIESDSSQSLGDGTDFGTFIETLQNAVSWIWSLFQDSPSPIGTDGDDRLQGTTGNDHFVGKEGDDIAKGGPGDDIFDLGPGYSIALGGPGNDTFLASQNRSIFVGGSGTDRYVFPNSLGKTSVLDWSSEGLIEIPIAKYSDLALERSGSTLRISIRQDALSNYPPSFGANDYVEFVDYFGKSKTGWALKTADGSMPMSDLTEISLKDAVQLSMAAYLFDAHPVPPPAGYVRDSDFGRDGILDDPSSGVYIQAYRQIFTDNVTLVFKGTDGLNGADWHANAHYGYPQWEASREEIRAFLLRAKANGVHTVNLVGYSLGGSIPPHLLYEFASDPAFKGMIFNAVLINAPGVKDYYGDTFDPARFNGASVVLIFPSDDIIAAIGNSEYPNVSIVVLPPSGYYNHLLPYISETIRNGYPPPITGRAAFEYLQVRRSVLTSGDQFALSFAMETVREEISKLSSADNSYLTPSVMQCVYLTVSLDMLLNERDSTALHWMDLETVNPIYFGFDFERERARIEKDFIEIFKQRGFKQSEAKWKAKEGSLLMTLSRTIRSIKKYLMSKNGDVVSLVEEFETSEVKTMFDEVTLVNYILAQSEPVLLSSPTSDDTDDTAVIPQITPSLIAQYRLDALAKQSAISSSLETAKENLGKASDELKLKETFVDELRAGNKALLAELKADFIRLYSTDEAIQSLEIKSKTNTDGYSDLIEKRQRIIDRINQSNTLQIAADLVMARRGLIDAERTLARSQRERDFWIDELARVNDYLSALDTLSSRLEQGKSAINIGSYVTRSWSTPIIVDDVVSEDDRLLSFDDLHPLLEPRQLMVKSLSQEIAAIDLSIDEKLETISAAQLKLVRLYSKLLPGPVNAERLDRLQATQRQLVFAVGTLTHANNILLRAQQQGKGIKKAIERVEAEEQTIDTLEKTLMEINAQLSGFYSKHIQQQQAIDAQQSVITDLQKDLLESYDQRHELAISRSQAKWEIEQVNALMARLAAGKLVFESDLSGILPTIDVSDTIDEVTDVVDGLTETRIVVSEKDLAEAINDSLSDLNQGVAAVLLHLNLAASIISDCEARVSTARGKITNAGSASDAWIDAVNRVDAAVAARNRTLLDLRSAESALTGAVATVASLQSRFDSLKQMESDARSAANKADARKQDAWAAYQAASSKNKAAKRSQWEALRDAAAVAWARVDGIVAQRAGVINQMDSANQAVTTAQKAVNLIKNLTGIDADTIDKLQVEVSKARTKMDTARGAINQLPSELSGLNGLISGAISMIEKAKQGLNTTKIALLEAEDNLSLLPTAEVKIRSDLATLKALITEKLTAAEILAARAKALASEIEQLLVLANQVMAPAPVRKFNLLGETGGSPVTQSKTLSALVEEPGYVRIEIKGQPEETLIVQSKQSLDADWVDYTVITLDANGLGHVRCSTKDQARFFRTSPSPTAKPNKGISIGTQ